MSANLSTLLGVSLLRTTKEYIEALEQMGIRTVEDLLLYLPRPHEDLSLMQTIASASLETKVTIRGTVDAVKLVRTRKGKQLVTARFIDTEGDNAELVWFNQPHIKRMVKDGDEVVITGKLIENGYKLQMQSPQFEKGGQKPLVHAGRLVPIYPQHERITTRWLREKMALLKDAVSQLPETLPPDIVKEEKLLGRGEAIRALHFPASGQDVTKAMERMMFEKMYDLQAQALERKKQWQGISQKRLQTPMNVELIRALFASLHFTPTGSQKVAIYEILKDMEREVPMSRLLQGDVGSGKTLVAVSVMANAIRHGGQSALMVPTEVLARQHAEGITRLLINVHSYIQKLPQSPLKNFPLPRLALLTGSTPRSEADEIKRGLASGTVDMVIGTHALIEETVQFKDLRLVIVDEQHRFGVLQRERLRERGSPHFLSMPATQTPPGLRTRCSSRIRCSRPQTDWSEPAINTAFKLAS